jgi:hypothetical protein
VKHKNASMLHNFGQSTSTPTKAAAPAVTAIGAVTELNPEEHITGMLITAREMKYAATSVGVACQFF